MSRTIIELEDIFKRFYIGTPNELEVLHGISLKVMEGEFVAIVGASGSGKSTLIKLLLKELEPPKKYSAKKFQVML